MPDAAGDQCAGGRPSDRASGSVFGPRAGRPAAAVLLAALGAATAFAACRGGERPDPTVAGMPDEPPGAAAESTGAAPTDAAATAAAEALAAEAAANDPEAAAFAGPIEEAQGVDAWRAHRAFQADVLIESQGKTRLDGRLLFATDFSGVALRTADGVVAVFDGERAWVSPADAVLPRARFDLLTWPYFIAAPFKLRDPGAHLEPGAERELSTGTEERYSTARLTFDSGVGDTSDDWYVVFRDPATDRLAALAYVVTYGTTLDEAAADPHAITYHDFPEVEGTELATSWTFWHWDPEDGIHGDPIATARLTGLRFVEPPPGAFVRPADAREEPLPPSGAAAEGGAE
jgi:hypothetical protein